MNHSCEYLMIDLSSGSSHSVQCACGVQLNITEWIRFWEILPNVREECSWETGLQTWWTEACKPRNDEWMQVAEEARAAGKSIRLVSWAHQAAYIHQQGHTPSVHTKHSLLTVIRHPKQTHDTSTPFRPPGHSSCVSSTPVCRTSPSGSLWKPT